MELKPENAAECVAVHGGLDLPDVTDYRGEELWSRAASRHEGRSRHVFAQMEALRESRTKGSI